ncbi:MAG: helix-turn-helix domain-containing protein [Deltaproteobacteria bacterium]|nr:helix-turn-helix domain-containing protein [Deltaproteobacteria bacterium]MBW2382309.1 helix-turn-helix domain-containing protein [Deltaproteobacteria bacterium]MBW2697696.1 helix-turn-helix domain-containing protein [Deltaproteobacteria bacterium]
MRSLYEQDYYEVLEVGRGASPEEIERAYHVVRGTYADDSLALYSIFGERDSSVIRERIDEAYRVLADEGTRRAYDAQVDQPALGNGASAGASARQAADPRAVEVPPDDSPLPDVEVESLSGASDAFRDLEADVEEERGDFDGAMLRRARMRRGFDLDQIADITKVSIANLSHIEEENFADLPATVYVRGFLTAYARTIGLEPTRVVASYLVRLDSERGAHARSSFLGRH